MEAHPRIVGGEAVSDKLTDRWTLWVFDERARTSERRVYLAEEADARIAALEAEVADLSRRLTTESRRVLIQQRDDARDEADKLRADAERYRWLREYNTVRHPEVTEAFFLGDANLDAAIDAARSAP